MKKYIFGLVAVLFLTVLIVPNFSLAQNTLPTDIDPNDTVSDCISITNNLRYRDRDANKNGEVSTLQDFLQIKGYLNSEPTGYFGILTLKAVKDFQRDNNINPTGYVGTITRAKIKVLTCDGTIISPPNPTTSIAISSISGPQSLNINQQGTWTVNASSSNGGTLSYSVIWGDEVYATTRSSQPTASQSPQQSATFTHSYSTAGTYTATFTVTNTSGQSAKTSLNVKVGNTTTPSITVLSPNGGETYKIGEELDFKWESSGLSNKRMVIMLDSVDINHSYGTSLDILDTSTGFVSWIVGSSIPAGRYKACMSSTGTNMDGAIVASDCSNSFFTITSSTTAQPAIYIAASSNGKVSYSSMSINVGDEITISGIPKNIEGLSYWTGAGNPPSGYYNKAYFFDHIFDNSCGKSDSVGDIPWYLTCTAKVAGSSTFYVEIYTNGQTYRSNKITVTINNSTNSNPVLNPIAVPSGMNVGKSYNFYFSATDADNDNLSWDINWGDSGGGGACPITNSQQKQGWTYNTSHAWNTAGTYNVKVSVNDCKGGTASSTFSVTVNNVITLATTVFYPNGGETMKWSDPLLVSFTPIYGQRAYINLIDINNAAYDLLSYNYINNLLGISADKQNVTLKLPVSWIATHGTQYKVEVCTSNVCDKSDNYFNITFLLGDVNADGSITCADINMILSAVVENITFSADQKLRADVDGDSSITAVDASGLMQMYNLSCSTVGSVLGSSLAANALGALTEENSQTNNIPTFVESSCKFTMNLNKGMINEEVKCLQKMLSEKGFKVEGIESGKETTLFGYNTLMALKKFQASNGLTADGIFGPTTREALKK